jgi:hypothetical protein
VRFTFGGIDLPESLIVIWQAAKLAQFSPLNLLALAIAAFGKVCLETETHPTERFGHNSGSTLFLGQDLRQNWLGMTLTEMLPNSFQQE